ncbi:Methyl-accepting chemotaxis protein [Ferrimonas sediminum]|uniref:Methyl-accepting chemotaxis protein n=1 Tax=Ferrimonas sediminum TaxID=718193 RepID=A0A1G8LQZ1_9GAMM|nr:methyl-accepting chemotaxis protein [Ferrimonas sediminum]SDI58104.1 Methyl-accepting chemotaxis protein [Ferrimonas sediminum]
MNWFRASLTRQLVASIGGSLFLILTLVTVYQVNQSRQQAREQVGQQVDQLVSEQASAIAAFFEAKGQVIHAAFSSPQIKRFFRDYDQRGGSLQGNGDYHEVTDYFRFFSDQDPAIKSLFFGSNLTHEYFDLNGRYSDDPNYYTNKRPWWGEAIGKDRLYVTDPAVDANDGSVSATVKRTVYDHDGRFLGIGGMDILITTIGDSLLSKIKYQQQGQAFLMTEQGKLVFFPAFSDRFPPGSLLAEVDSQFSDARGFADLSRQLMSQPSGMASVRWQGQPQRVQWQPVDSDYPQMHWRLGFMLPAQVVDVQVTREAWSTGLASVLLTLLVSAVVWLLLLPLKTQIRQLVRAMEEIAQGDGDLSSRIEVSRDDELGQLGRAFNLFAERVHLLVNQSKELTRSVSRSSEVATDIWGQTLASMSAQKGEVEQASAATNEMAQTSAEMARSADTVTEHAQQVTAQMRQAGKAVEQGKQALAQLSAQVGDASGVVSRLRQNADQIGEVLDVIRTIAEQTNLLALNAAIEAARAGEQGRGFAVVADEVRTLASKTQDSTANIQAIIATLQQSSIEAEKAMEASCLQVDQSQVSNQQIVDTLTEAGAEVGRIEHQVQEMTQAISQQARVAEAIATTVSRVHELSDDAVARGDQLERNLEQLSEGGHQLASGLDRYQV